MKTSSYSYFRCDFTDFNPVQAACAHVFAADYNIVVSTPTASGKTTIAECVFGHVLHNGGSVVYASPMKALLHEKYQRWIDRPEFAPHTPTLLTGDDSATEDMLTSSSMVLSTLESLYLQVIRNALWLQRVGCLVVDEAHIIGDPERGALLEALLMRFTRLNPVARLLLLSGTLYNALQVATWVKALNRKPTNLVRSDWQPVKTEKTILDVTPKTMQAEVLRLVVEVYPHDQTLVFVHSKKTGKELTKYLTANGVKTAFYRADLSRKQRDSFGEAFRQQQLPVLVTTSSLAMGVNL
jgi:helicase